MENSPNPGMLKEIGEVVTQYINDRTAQQGLSIVQLTEKLQPEIGLKFSSVMNYISTVKNNPPDLIFSTKNNERKGIGRLSYLLHALGVPEEDPLIQAIYTQFPDFIYPPRTRSIGDELLDTQS